MSLFRQAGASLLSTPISYKEQRQRELKTKREKQLEYMRELDQQVRERNEQSKSRSKSKERKRLVNRSAMAYGSHEDTGQQDPYSKSALLDQLLNVDYETFKRTRPQKSRSRSNKKYHLLEEIHNEGQYKQIPDHKTVFVDAQGRQISVGNKSALTVSEQRDDKNYYSHEVSAMARVNASREEQQSQEGDPTEKSMAESHHSATEGRQSSPSPDQPKMDKEKKSITREERTQPIDSNQVKALSSLVIAQHSFRPTHSDRIATLINDNRHRFPNLLEAITKPDLQKELAELENLIETIIEPRQRTRAVTKPVEHDELIQIKDILKDIESISTTIPTDHRKNRFIDRELVLHKKINEKIGVNRKHPQSQGMRKSLQQMIDSYPSLRQ